MQYTYPRTIENGSGERLTFLARVPGARGDRVEAENVVSPGAGPPMHAHFFQEEVFTVRAGRMGYQRRGEPARFAGPGETVAFAPFLLRRYRGEFAMYEIPAPVQRFVFPLLVAVGHVLGRYRKYADALAPIERTLRGTEARADAVAPRVGTVAPRRPTMH